LGGRKRLFGLKFNPTNHTLPQFLKFTHREGVLLSAQKSQHLPFFFPVSGPLPFGPVPSFFGIFSPNTGKKKGLFSVCECERSNFNPDLNM